MGKPLLFLRLEGPLQAWGLRARWDVRDTGDEPSKSGVIGLLGSALGYPRSDPRLEELDHQLTMGVRVERPGSRLTDFQTASGSFPTAMGGVRGSADDPATIVSPRAYLQDAAFLVVLGGPPELLGQCQAALMRPRWPIYLGRKACPPTRPVLVGITDAYDTIDQAVRKHPWNWEGREDLRDPLPTKLRCVLETEDGRYLRPDWTRANPARMYGNRAVEDYWVGFPGAADALKGEAV